MSLESSTMIRPIPGTGRSETLVAGAPIRRVLLLDFGPSGTPTEAAITKRNIELADFLVLQYPQLAQAPPQLIAVTWGLATAPPATNPPDPSFLTPGTPRYTGDFLGKNVLIPIDGPAFKIGLNVGPNVAIELFLARQVSPAITERLGLLQR